ncbi:MAG: ArnT family glycosyltransferase [Tepidisphaeraceae bacterium]
MLDQGDSGSTSTAAFWWPVIGASVVIAVFSIAVSVVRIPQVYPHDGWEAIIVADAYRASVGLPVYTDPRIDHSTHMYGPLSIYTVGLIFRGTGVNLIAGRVVHLVATIWIIAALAVIYFRRLPWIFTIAGLAMLMSLNLRVHAFFTQTKSDMPALGFSLLALILFFQAMERRRWACYPLALLSFCVAYLFKQTAAMFTIVPLLSLLLRRQWSIRDWLVVAAPPATIVALIIAISVIVPAVHYHMIIAVSRWPMRFDILLISPLRLFSYFTLVPVALCMMTLIRPGISLSDPTLRWLIAACVGSFPGSCLAYSKLAGSTNSFLPALLPMIVLSIVGIAAEWESTPANLIPAARTRVFAWLMALVMMLSAVEISKASVHALFVEGHGDGNSPRVVQYIRKLKGRVVCPDDPTIPIRALGQPCRSSWAENDTNVTEWLSPYLRAEILSADYVVVVNASFLKYLSPSVLRSWDFVPEGWGGADMGTYALWRKSRTGGAENESPLRNGVR